MVSLSSYRTVLSRPGTLKFSLTGVVARLPISMTGLGIVLLVQAATDSYGVAGAVSAAFMVANALVAIGMGRLVDGVGQGVVLSTASAVYGSAMVVLVWSVESDWPIGVSYVAAALAGTALPPIGSCVRARWSYVLGQPKEVQTAFALEAVLDEVVFIVGPILVAVLAVNVSPVLGLATAIIAGVAGSLAFAAQKGTEPPAHPHDRSAGVRPPMPWRTVTPLAIVCLALGILFGAAEVTTVAFADEQGHKGYAGGAAGPVGARQPRRRRRHRGDRLDERTGRPGPLGRVRDGGRDGAALLRRLDPADGSAAAGRRGGHRADDGGRALADRTHRSSLTADRGHVDHAHRDRRRRRARCDDQRPRHRPLRRVRCLPGQPRRGRHRGGRRAGRAARRRSRPGARRPRPASDRRGADAVSGPAVWRNWSGLETADPTRVVQPVDAAEVAAEVTAARASGSRVKMIGAGHSFTAIGAPSATMLTPGGLIGIVEIDRDAMTVTAGAGTLLKDLNLALERAGLSLHNMGDIAEQTLAGAISTGTHGSGGQAASLAAQVVGLELVAGTGDLLRATADDNPDVLEMARVGLGALGVVTTVTFRVEPLFVLEARERPMSWDEALATYDEMTATSDHVDMYWFPHTDRVLAKRNQRRGTDLSQARPLGRFRAWLDDDFLQNTVFGMLTAGANRVPRAIPRMNRFAAGLLSERTYSDVPHRVFTAERAVVFREMEYAVPREAGLEVLAEARRAIDASDLQISFPVEIRTAPADDIPLSTAYRRDSLYLAFHTHRDAEHRAYFALLEPIMRAHDGRPHWGKVHTRTATDLEPVYPRFGDFLAMRDRLDPDRVFTNDHLRRILGA